MKNIIKKLLGERLMFYIREFRTQYYPTPDQRHIQEQEELFLPLRKALFSSFLEKGDLCFDVGANMGNRIKPLLDIGMKVVAIEPQEICIKYLRYKFGNKIVLETKALGPKEDARDFFIAKSSTISSFSEDWINAVKTERFKGVDWVNAGKVQMTTLDHLIRRYGVPVFIKIDVEGFENEVLQGLSHPIRMISYEYTVPEQTEKAADCLKLIYKQNPEIECNFCQGESMKWELDQWLPMVEMMEYIKSEDFQKTSFGDIYVRSIAK
jgi:FkbM family methyltransferase